MSGKINVWRVAGMAAFVFLLVNVVGQQARTDDKSDRWGDDKPPWAMDPGEMFAAMDADGDGNVTEDEFEEMYEKKAKKMRQQVRRWRAAMARRAQEHKAQEESKCGKDCKKCEGKGCGKGKSKCGKDCDKCEGKGCRKGKSGKGDSDKGCRQCCKGCRGAARRGPGRGPAQVVHVHHHHYYAGGGPGMHHRGSPHRHHGPGHRGHHKRGHGRDHGDRHRGHHHRTDVDWDLDAEEFEIDGFDTDVDMEVDIAEYDANYEDEYDDTAEDQDGADYEDTLGQAEVESTETVAEESDEAGDSEAEAEAAELTETSDQDDTDAV